MHTDPSAPAQLGGTARKGGYRIVLAILGIVVVGLVLAQLLLPSIAAQRARERVERYGTVTSVSVSAFPAVKLLWGKMDNLDVRTANMHVGVTQIGGLLSSARSSNDMTFSSPQTRLLANSFAGGGLVLRDVDLHKHGMALDSQATVREADLRAALPAGFQIQPVASGAGAVEVHASGALFGVEASIDGVITASEGKLIVQPVGIPFGNLLRVTLFSDPRIFINGIAAQSQPDGYRFTIDAQLR
jgi:hypothetical protein